jgi:hypothetical protein
MASSNLYNFPSLPNQQKEVRGPTAVGTACFLAGIFFALISVNPGMTPSEMAHQASIPLGVGFVLSIWFDKSAGDWKNLFRTDLVCLLVFYALTFLEFITPQEFLTNKLTSQQALSGINVTLIAFAGIVIGRHFTILKPVPKKWLNFSQIPDRSLFIVFLISAFLGEFYILQSVDFDIEEVMKQMLNTRFSQTWSRGQYGGLTSLMSELKLLRFVIPPIAGILWNRRKSINNFQMAIVILVLAYVFYQGFTGGTRNIFGAYLIGFFAGYLLSLERIKIWKILVPIGFTGYIMSLATRHMLAFRNMGLRRYIESEAYKDTFESASEEGLQLDFSLWHIGTIVESMPNQYDFLGWELINVFATKPIPRALWAGKPDQLSNSIGDIVGINQMTVAATYVGESYMMAGIIGVIIVSLIIGAASNWWTRTMFQQSSGYAVAVGATGFFVAAMTMRSLSFFTTNILPILALIFLVQVVPSWIGAKQRQ